MAYLTRLATSRPIAVCVVAIALVILGWTSWRNLPLDLLPDLQSPTIVVSIRSGDRPPSEMERLYGEQVEQRLFTVRGIREINQVARSGRLVATVRFHWGTDMDFALVEVEKAAGPIRSDVDVDEVLIRRFDPRQLPIVAVGLVADEDGPDLAELRRVAERQLATALERLEGIAEVRVTGGREREVRVWVDPYKLEAQQLTLVEVESRLVAANLDVNAGTLEEDNQVFIVRGLSRLRDPEDVSRVVLRYREDTRGHRVPVRVRDIGRVGLTNKEIRHLVRVDGAEGVGLAIYKEAGANTVRASRTVKDALAGLRGDLPGIDVRLISDEAALVEDAISDVKQAALWGIGLAVLVLVLFLRSPGPTVVVATAVPVSLLTTLFAMHLGGQSLNLMTLGGLALGAGMLVDNAIVVVEAIFRRRGDGLSPTEAAWRGTTDVSGAILASTLTTCAVFLPVIFVRGLSARLVAGLSFAVVVSLVSSLGVALFLIPAISRWLLPRQAPARQVTPGRGWIGRVVNRLLAAPALVVLLAFAAAGGAVMLLLGLGTELLPPSDSRQFSVRLVGPPGQPVEATERTSELVEAILRAAAGEQLAATLSEIGQLPEDDRLITEEQNEENSARLRVRLSGEGPSGKAVVAAASAAVEQLGRLETSWEVGQSALSRALGTSGPPVVVEISGQSLTDLRFGAERVQAALAGLPTLWNVRSSFEGGPPELRVELDRMLADALGLEIDGIAATLEASLDGRVATQLILGDEERDVVLSLPTVRREQLPRVAMRAPSGARVAVGEIARLVPVQGAREIFRRDQRRVARVTAHVASGYEFPEALTQVRQALDDLGELPGLRRPQLIGEERERVEAFADLRVAGLLALLLVFMVLAGNFESLIHPVTVVSAIPLSAIGVAAVLVPLGRPIGVMELLGVIVLSGVAVNDAILLVSAARRLMREGLVPRAALVRAAEIRLRPILMTSATTILALVPLAIGGGDAARLRSPLALTVIGGVAASTVTSLLVIPCLYMVLDRLTPGRRG